VLTSRFFTAIRDGNVDLVRSLLDHGANIEGKNELGFTPLISAVLSDKAKAVEFIKLLLGRGANIEGRSSDDGNTPLYWAVVRDKTEIETIHVLLERGADIEAKDINGGTPLSLATEKGKTAIVKLMQDSKAKNEINGKLIDAIRKSHCSVQAAVYCGSELEGGAFPDGHELGSALMVKTNRPPCTMSSCLNQARSSR
jgi:ankyrin repeat protein